MAAVAAVSTASAVSVKTSTAPSSWSANTSGATPTHMPWPSQRAASTTILGVRSHSVSVGMAASHPDRHGHGGDAAKDVVHVPYGLAGELEAGHLVGESVEQRGGLQLRESLPHTAVNAGAETDVSRSVTVDVESIRVLPASLVPVGGGVADEDPVAGGQRD